MRVFWEHVFGVLFLLLLRGNTIAESWWSHLVKCNIATSALPKASAHEVLGCLCGCKKTTGLFAQLVMHLALRAGDAVDRALEDGPYDQPYAITGRYQNLLDFIRCAKQCDHELLRYSLCTKESSRGCHMFHWSSDKANVGKLGLVNTLVTFGADGRAAIMCPQVL